MKNVSQTIRGVHSSRVIQNSASIETTSSLLGALVTGFQGTLWTTKDLLSWSVPLMHATFAAAVFKGSPVHEGK